MDTENNHLQLRIAIGGAFVVAGAAMAGPALSRMLQTGPWPWWAVLLLGLGVIILILGLLILIVPPKSWRGVWKSVQGFPGWIVKVSQWKLYGAKYTIGDPIVKLETDSTGGRYIVTTSIWVKNTDRYAIEVGGSMWIELKQKTDWEWKKLRLDGYLGEKKQVEPHCEATVLLPLTLAYCGTHWLDFNKPYHWTISPLSVKLRGVWHKLSSKKGWTNAPKAQP